MRRHRYITFDDLIWDMERIDDFPRNFMHTSELQPNEEPKYTIQSFEAIKLQKHHKLTSLVEYCVRQLPEKDISYLLKINSFKHSTLFDKLLERLQNEHKSRSIDMMKELKDRLIPIRFPHIPSRDIELVVAQVVCTRTEAAQALDANQGDIVDAIMELQF
jgi:NACalpha-BTF3-like transcription factor